MFVEVERYAAVLRAPVALELDHALKIAEGSRARVLLDIHSAAAGDVDRLGGGGADVDVRRALEIAPFDVLVGHADREIVRQSVLDSEARLIDARILKIGSEDEDSRLRKGDSRRNRREAVRILRCEALWKVDGQNLNAVLGVRRSDHDGRR